MNHEVDVLEIDRDLNHLAEEIRPSCRRLMLRAEAATGIPLLVTETWRSRERQAWLFANNKTKAKPGWSPHEIFADREGTMIPVALAFDICFSMPSGKISYEGPWRTVEAIAEELCGLEWGGDWDETRSCSPRKDQIIDRPHFQLPKWKEIARDYGWTFI